LWNKVCQGALPLAGASRRLTLVDGAFLQIMNITISTCGRLYLGFAHAFFNDLRHWFEVLVAYDLASSFLNIVTLVHWRPLLSPRLKVVFLNDYGRALSDRVLLAQNLVVLSPGCIDV
jgi:hypothetical protein